MNTKEYLERVRAHHGGCSDYRLAKLLQVDAMAVSRYMRGREMDDDVALRAADLAGIPRVEVVANVRRARAAAEGQGELADFWSSVATMILPKVKPAALRMAGPATATATAPAKSAKKPRRWRSHGDSNSPSDRFRRRRRYGRVRRRVIKPLADRVTHVTF